MDLKENIDVSLILPVYNINHNDLDKCLNSILNQTAKKIEIIIVDDGSSNNCEKIYSKYAELDKRFIIFQQENKGVSIARNVGIEYSRGKWLAFIDPDDWVEPRYIETLLAHESDSTDIIICNCKVNSYGVVNENKFTNSTGNCYFNDTDVLFNQLLGIRTNRFYPPKVSVGVPWGKLFRKSFVFENELRFIPGMKRMQDNIFCMYAFSKAKKIYLVDECLYNYRMEAGSASFKYNSRIVSDFTFYFSAVSHFIEITNCLDKTLFKTKLDIKKLKSVNSFLLYYYFHNDSDVKYSDAKHEITIYIDAIDFPNVLKSEDFKVASIRDKCFIYALKYKVFSILFLYSKVISYIKKF